MTREDHLATIGTVCFVVILVALALVSCQRRETQEVRPGYTPLQVGGHRVWASVAATDAARDRGLMDRLNLPEDEGMLFVFAEKAKRRFWMKGTLLPLDIAYIDDSMDENGERIGTIVDILQMEPEPNTPHHLLKDYESSGEVRFVLEVNQGWFERHGVKSGDRVAGLPDPVTTTRRGGVNFR